MIIKVKLTGLLVGKMPNEVELVEGTTVIEMLKMHNIDKQVAFFVINHTVGQHNWECVLKDGNEITLLGISCNN